MPWGAAAAIGSAAIGAYGSKKAAGQQSRSADKANALQWQMYDTNKDLLQPFISGGTDALSALRAFLGIGEGGAVNPNAPGARQFTMADFTADPGYAFRLQQGQDEIKNQHSALGGAFSGGTLKDLTQFSQGIASDEFTNAYNRFVGDQSRRYNMLTGLTGQGLGAASSLAGVGQNTAAQINANLLDQGNAQAAGTVGMFNAFGQGLGDAWNNYQGQKLLSRYMNQGAVPTK